MSSRFLNAAGAAAIAAMLVLSVQTSSAQITFPWERSPQGSPQGPAQSDDADLEMRIQRLENQLRQLTGQNEELQFRNRQLEDRLRQLGAAPPAPGGQPPMAQPNVAAAPPPVQPGSAAGAAGLSATRYPQQAPASRVIRRPSPATTSSRRSPRPRPSCRNRQPRRPAAAAAAMPSTRTRIPTPRARRARSAAARCRCRAKRRSARRAGAVRANHSISAVRAIPVAPCRRPLQPHRRRAAPGPAPAPR